MAGSVLRAFCWRSSVNSSSDNGPNDPILTGIRVSFFRYVARWQCYAMILAENVFAD